MEGLEGIEMSKPVLSICIPTYNRSSYLEDTLSVFTQEKIFLETDDIEIVISDNCSTDETENVCHKFIKKFPSKITYFKQKENIRDKNFAAVLNMAKGNFAKLNHDHVFFSKGELEKFINFLKENKTDDIILLSNGSNRLSGIYKCNNFNDVLDKISYNITWIGAYCFRVSPFKKLKEPDRYSHLNFSQIDMLSRLMKNGSSATIYADKVMDGISINGKGGYSVPLVFGHNYMKIIDEIFLDNRINLDVYKKHKKTLLIKHINKFCFNQKDTTCLRTNYFRYLLPIYGKNAYFWGEFIKENICSFFRLFISVQRNKKEKILNIKILFWKFSRKY